MTKLFRTALAAGGLLAVAACAGPDGDGGATGATSPTTSAIPASTTPASTASTDPASTTSTAPGPSTAATADPATTIASATSEPTGSTAPTTATPSSDGWTPIGPGPYDVGVATVTVGDPAGERPLTVEVWFPLADAVDVAESAAQRYILLPGVYYESPGAFAATAEDLRAGSFPLVAYSHGSGGIRYLHSAYTEVLAGHGYVVVAPDHTGNTVLDRFTGGGTSGDTIAVDRPDDVRRVIDAFVDPDHPTAGPYAASVDGDRIAVTGHSLGGYTAIALAAGADTPQGEVTPDGRVGAIVPLAPATGRAFLPDDRIGALDVPMMVIVGADDRTTPVDPNVTRLWDLSANEPAYRVELLAGEHQTFTDLCRYAEFLPTLESVPALIIDTIEEFGAEGCSDGDIDDVRAAEITSTYVVGFLDEVFRERPPVTAIVVAPPDVVVLAR